MRSALVAAGLFGGWLSAQGPFAPQAGEPGSTAVHKDSSAIHHWATGCTVVRGHRQANLPDSGLATTGIDVYATGPADAPLCVSLGDGGVATLHFAIPISDGAGYDFAVFENGFGSGSEAFLELAFVEVSSDGVHFFRFEAATTRDTSVQCGSFENSDASYYHNLAGKYTAGFGTPFDLAELPDTVFLDKNQVRYVRVMDVVGSILPSVAQRDASGVMVNDPWPTNFPQSGFDLDAIAVLNSNYLGLSEGTRQKPHEGKLQTVDLLGRSTGNTGIVISVDEYGQAVKAFLIEP